MTRATRTIVRYLDRCLDIAGIPDESCNGLQVAGKEKVRRVALAVDASLESYRRATESGCEMLLVHHGLVWGGIRTVKGLCRKHLKYLLDHGLNLYAAHLPLDLHPRLGNNIKLAEGLGLKSVKPFGDYHGRSIGFMGHLPEPLSREKLAARLAALTGRPPRVLESGRDPVKTVGIVSGGGGKIIFEALEKELDCFVTGESSHSHYGPARESETGIIYLGHYHSETAGLKALGEDLSSRFGLKIVFLDLPPNEEAP